MDHWSKEYGMSYDGRCIINISKNYVWNIVYKSTIANIATRYDVVISHFREGFYIPSPSRPIDIFSEDGNCSVRRNVGEPSTVVMAHPRNPVLLYIPHIRLDNEVV
jgi:hypothetical protein